VVDTFGSVFLVLALQRGLLTLVPVIASLYPAGTVLLARVVLRERIGRIQALGLALAGLAIVLIGIS
jgi:drug/metabolite transporter (DMT)-like permease